MSNDNKSQDDGAVCPICGQGGFVQVQALNEHRLTHSPREDTEMLRTTVVDEKVGKASSGSFQRGCEPGSHWFGHQQAGQPCDCGKVRYPYLEDGDAQS